MSLVLTRRTAIGAGLAAASFTRVKAQERPIRIGVLTDFSGNTAANTGKGSILGAQMAVEDFARSNPDIRAEVVAADLQEKTDIALSKAAAWFDNDDIDVVTDVPLSPAAFAIGDLARRKDKVAIFTGGSSSDITGIHCGPNHLHWVYDTWSMSHASVSAAVKEGGDTWFFITADYAQGKSSEHDAAGFVAAAGGKVLGVARHPYPNTSDFSSFILQAQASGAKVIGLANNGINTVDCLKQCSEFGVIQSGQKIVSLIMRLHDVHGAGLQAAQGTLLSEPFYWDLNDGTRDFARRYAARFSGLMPGCVHAGQYSAVTHYLKAVAAIGVAQAKASGLAAVQQMKATPTEDALFGQGAVRKDGRVIHNMYLFQVKSPGQSTGPWDYYTLKQTIPAVDAFRPLTAGGCSMI